MTNGLTVFEKEGQLLVSSIEIAEMVGKDHKHLMGNIDGYIDVLKMNPNLGAFNF